MAVDLNADVGKIIKDFLTGKKADPRSKRGKKSLDENYKQALLKATLILCVMISICYGVHEFGKDPIKRDKSEYIDNQQLKEAIDMIEINIMSGKAMFRKNKKAASDIIDYFSDTGDSKSLFRTISVAAAGNSLILKNITKGNTEKISKPMDYEKTTVLLEIEGSYANYISFKQDLLEEKPYLTVNVEKIKVLQNGVDGRTLSITLELFDYSVDRTKYEDLIAKTL